MSETAIPVRTRGYKKKERTRRQLVEAGVRVLAARGEGLTVSDVVAEAEVSNGTFYNYFPDREVFIDAVAEHSALALAATGMIVVFYRGLAPGEQGSAAGLGAMLGGIGTREGVSWSAPRMRRSTRSRG